MKRKRILMRYYKQKLYKGRTALARSVDFVALRLITLAACYLWFTTLVDNTVMAIVLSVTALATISVAIELYKSIRLDRFIRHERMRLGKKLFQERLCIMPRKEFLGIVKEFIRHEPEKYPGNRLVYLVQCAAPVDENTVLSACRAASARGLNGIVLFSTSPIGEAARSLLTRYPNFSADFVTPGQLERYCADRSLTPSDADIDAAILAAMEARRKKRKRNATGALSASRARHYVVIAAALFVMSFFVKYTLYYRLLSAACISFGAMAWWLSNLTPARES